MTDADDKERLNVRLPTKREKDSAAGAATALATAMEQHAPVRIGSTDVELEPAVADMLIGLLGHLARGNMVTFVPRGAMLSTQQAADILNVSRPFLSKLLKAGEIAFVPVGAHRRVWFDDLMSYKRDRDKKAKEGLAELSRLGQEYDAG